MDAWETLETMVTLFKEIVSCHGILERIENGQEVVEGLPPAIEMIAIVDRNFGRLKQFRRGGKAFDQIAYAAQMRQMIYEAEENGDNNKSQEHFAEYFEFITLVRDLRSYPDLILCFRKADLAEWTRLKIDRETLIEYALGFIEGLEEAVEAGTEINQEIALHAGEIADFYKIELSPKLLGTIKFYLDDSEEWEGDEEGDGSATMLQ
jgi:hypothetical protein